MCAVSRKRYIGEAYGIADAGERDAASAAEALMACELGASVVRAHNVEETKSLADLRPYALIALRCECRACRESGRRTEGKIANLQQQAITGLCSIPDTQIVDISSFYSEPAYYEDQDTFVNAMVLLAHGRSAERAPSISACHRKQPWSRA